MGLAICTLKNSIRGPIKNAVIMVPTPAIVGIFLTCPPAVMKRITPRITQIRSEMILTYWNFPFFQVLQIIRAIASYVDTPRSAVI